MKQEITKEQWNELTGEQKHKLMEAISGCAPMTGHLINPKYTIGQMIEFLGEEPYLANRPHKTLMKGWWEELFDAGFVDCGCEEPHDIKLEKLYKGELCDALWKAVKHKLTQ